LEKKDHQGEIWGSLVSAEGFWGEARRSGSGDGGDGGVGLTKGNIRSHFTTWGKVKTVHFPKIIDANNDGDNDEEQGSLCYIDMENGMMAKEAVRQSNGMVGGVLVGGMAMALRIPKIKCTREKYPLILP